MKISYKFNNQALVQQALTHKSASDVHNERLEFLGDALLNLFISEELYSRFAEIDEGRLSRLRASLVNQDALAEIARTLELGPELIMGMGELKSGGQQKDSLLADAAEALIAAIYLDSDLTICRAVVQGWFKEKISAITLADKYKDAKSMLQELLQARHLPLPEYNLIDQQGPDNERIFTICCILEKLNLRVSAEGKSKKQAEQASAEKMLEILNKNAHDTIR